jgi:hypothetical protein
LTTHVEPPVVIAQGVVVNGTATGPDESAEHGLFGSVSRGIAKMGLGPCQGQEGESASGEPDLQSIQEGVASMTMANSASTGDKPLPAIPSE